ncbi:hypothetical protein [Crocinitomix catalasitica]|uniref:hypothetical protein n=1 Tax=Crocinitomix catalasitica TaxID=184607 RepID=UPI0004848017|nr:hypothetical protein [Crocinitomix catalasitica]
MKTPKTSFLFLLTCLTLITVACKKDTPKDDDKIIQVLPELTHEGKHTFGCKVNGEVWVARSGGGINGQRKLYAHYDAEDGEFYFVAHKQIYDENILESINLIQLKDVYGTGLYSFSISAFDGTPILCFFDAHENRTCRGYYHDSLHKSELNITFYDTINRIISGTFELDITNFDCEDSIMHITDGRFDVRYN